jgi:chromosome segregation ATPase
MPKTARRKCVGQKDKGACKDKNKKLHNKQASLNRKKIQLARLQAEVEQLEREEADLRQGVTARQSSRARRVIEEVSPEPKPKRTKQDEAETRVVIKYFYRQLQSPPEEDWDGHCGTISEIRRLMGDSAPGSATALGSFTLSHHASSRM